LTALKVDSLGNKCEQLNQIDHGDSEDLDEFDIPKSKKSKYRKRSSIGSKRTVGGRLRRYEETKQHHKSPKVVRTGIDDEVNIRLDPRTENLNLPVKKSRLLHNSESSSCDESQEDLNGPGKSSVVSTSSRSGFLYPQRAVTNREQVEKELTKHVKYCKSVGVDTSFLDFFAYKKPPNYRKPQVVNFMCLHNKCGFLDKEKCNSSLNCCHKGFTVPTDGVWVTTSFLRASFFRNIQVPDITRLNGYPSLIYHWNRALTFSVRSDEGNHSGQGFAGYKCGIIKNHLRNYHAGSMLPYFLFTIEDRKDLNPEDRGEVKKIRRYISKYNGERLTNIMAHVEINTFIQTYLSPEP
jgi:hypothetical protein